jgi:hypothetical protein
MDQFMNTDRDYIGHIREIRSMMERSSRFLSLSGLSGIFAGSIATIGGAFAYWYLRDVGFLTGSGTILASDVLTRQVGRFLLYDGLIILSLAIISVIFFSWLKARRQNLPVWDYKTRHILINLSVPLLAGGIFTLILLYHHQLYLLVPVTLLFYGIALWHAGNFTYSEVRFLGLLEVLTGLASALFLRYGLFFWIFGFGILHIFYGILVYSRYETGHRTGEE